MRRSNKIIDRLMKIPGAMIQEDRVKTKQVKLPGKPCKKPASTGMAGLKIGRNILMIDNENVKPGGKL